MSAVNAPAASPRWVRGWVAAVTLSAFGPYVAGGVRTEQLTVYGSLLVVALGGWVFIARRGGPGPVPFLGLWAALLVIATVGAAFPMNRTALESGSVLAGIDNLLAPFAMLLVAWCWVSAGSGSDLVQTAARVVVAAMTVNGLLAIASMLRGGVLPFPWLSMFWGSSAESSVAIRAASNGRYSGVFNQPAEAGIAYSLAVFCLLYLIQRSGRRGTVLFPVIGAVLTLGGIITVSKVFLFGGLPVIAYLVLRDRRRRVRLVVLGVIGAVALYVATTVGWLSSWSGMYMIRRLLGDNDNTLLRTLTSGRLGEDSTLSGPMQEVFDTHPVTGVGAGGLQVPYDSTWLEAMVVAGTVGVVLLAAVHVALLARWWAVRSLLPTAEAQLGLVVVILAAGASIGMPALTGNRVSTLFWVFLGLLVTSRSAGSPEQTGDQLMPSANFSKTPPLSRSRMLPTRTPVASIRKTAVPL